MGGPPGTSGASGTFAENGSLRTDPGHATVGPNDLSLSYGYGPGLAELPTDVEAGIRTLLAAAKRAGKIAGIHTYPIESARTRIAEGFRYVALSSDVRFVQSAARSTLQRVRE